MNSVTTAAMTSAPLPRLLALRSADGPTWDHFVFVPAHLNLDEVKAAFNTEITRLKDLNEKWLNDEATQNEENPDELTAESLKNIALSLQCIWVEDVHELGQPWDTN